MRKTRKGFNLIVLVIVIALIALLFCVTNKQFNIISGIAKSNQILQYYDENTVFVLYTKYLDENQTVLSPTTVKTQNMDQLNYKIDIPTIDGYTPKITELEGKLDLEGLEYLEKLDFVRIVVKDNIYNIYITINYAAAPSAYSVVYYEQKSDLSGYTEISREVIGKLGNSYDGSIVTGQKINIIPSEKEGFSINIGKTKTAGKVEAFGTKVFEIYYDRNNYYLYTYNTGDSYYEPMQVKYGQDLSLIEEPTYSGYVFDGWAYSTSMNGDKIEKPDTMPAYNLYAEAQWKRDATHYILSYYTENANDNGYTNIGTTEVSATSGDNLQNVDLTNEIENGFEEVRGDTAKYYHYNEEKTKEANNNFNVIVEGNGVTVVAIYYDRNVYTIEMDFNDSSYTTKGEVTKDGQVYTGSYSFQAKYDQDIMEEWLTAGDFTTFPTSTFRGRTTTYYFRGWKTDSSSSTYTSMRINLTSDLIADSTNGSTTVYEAQYVTSNSQKELFYMIESFDQETKTTSDTRKLYNGKYYDSDEMYYQLVYSTSTSWSAKQLAGLTSVGTQSSNPKFYFYYDRNIETITLYNMNNVHIEKQLKYGESLEEFSNTQLDANDFSLETPGTKEWKFEGWYQDSNYMLPMVWKNEDGTYKTIRENLVLYAKWSAPTYTVTFETNGGTWTEIDSRYVKVDDDTYTLTVEEGESLKKPTDPTKSGNVPVGWYYKVDSNEIEYLFSDSQKVYSDVKLNLKYLTNANVSYRVRYVQAQYEDGQLVEDISKYDNIVDLAEPKEVEGNLYGSTVYETPVDIYDAQNADNYFVVNMRDEELFLGSENINDNELYFLYAKNPTLSYSVYYVKYKEDENGNQITYDYGDVPSDDMLLGKKEGIVSAGYITERAEEIDGWTINGKESQTLKLVLNESDNTLYFYYDENTTGEYLVNFFFMNENGEYENTPDYTYTAVDSGGTILYASDFENFVFENGPTEETYRGRRLDKEKCENAYLIVTTTTETSAMDLYFENLTDLPYTEKYQDEDGNFLQDEKVVENQMYSSSVTEKAVDIKGYELIDGEQEEKTITIDIDNNEIIFTYKKLENLSYAVKYLEYGTNLEIADVKTVENNLYQSVVIEEAIDIEGYDKVDSTSQELTIDVTDNEIIFYYKKRADISYTVEYYFDNVIDKSKTELIKNQTYGDVITDYIDKIKTGYKFNSSTAPITLGVDNNVIKVYYVTDEEQIKELTYTVEYYKDGIIVDADTQIVTKTVQVLESDTLEVNKDEINTNNKYAGYRVASVYPEVIPDLVNNGDVIKVYYEKDEFEYRVEYYYDGLRYDENTENYVGTYNDVITTYTDKNVFGYKLEKTENLPLTITKDSEDNVIKIYYIIDEENTKTLSYTVEYYKNNELVLEDVQTVSKTVQVLEPNSLIVDKSQIDTTNKYQGYVFKGTSPETIPNVVLTGDIIKVFYEIRADLQYTVKYLENETTNEIISTKVVSDKAYNDEITEFAVDIPGYNKLKESETIKIGLGTNEIIFFYERKADLEYRVEYYYNGQRDNDKTEIHNATFLEEIEKYTNNALVGYKLEKEENFPLIINSDESKNIIRIYYVTDEEQTKEIKYTVEYYKENVLVEVDTQEEKKIVQALEPDILNVDKTQINTVDKYTGYKFDASATGTIPDVAKDGTVIKIYYVIDESNTKTLSYTVEYYKNGVIESIDTQVVSETVHILRPDTIDVRKGEINTSNKYDGYKLSELTPNPIPDKVANGTVIKVNYVTDENQRKDLSYTIEYYKDGEKQVAETKEVSINVQLLEPDTINVDKSEMILSGKYTGYKLDKTSPETIPSVVNNGDVIKIYYVKDQFGYKIEYYYDGQIDDTKTENYIVTYKDIIKEYADKNIFGYRLEKVEGAPLEVSEKTEENVIKVYYIIDDGNTKTLNYTVEYYKDGELQEGDTQIVSKTVQILESDVLEVNKSEINIIDKYVGYKLEKTMPDAIPDSVLTGETIKVYYVKDNFNYTIEYYYDGQLDASKTEISSEKYEQIIESYQDKTGGKYNLINAENFPLKISESSSNNIIKINYEKKKSKITVHYYLNNSKGGLVSQDIVIEDVVDTVHTINAASDVALKYELIKKPDLEQLTMTVDPIEVEYIYRLKDAKVIVNYVEKGVEKILGTDIIKGQVDDEYQAAPKAIEGYKYLTDKMPKNEAGKMTLDPITVNFYYEFITSSSPEVQTLPTTSTTQTTVGSVNGAKDNYNSKGPYTGDNDVYTNLAIILIVLSLNTIQITISYDGRKAVRKIKRTYECKRREKKEKRNNKISRISKEVINNRKPKHSSTRRERKH